MSCWPPVGLAFRIRCISPTQQPIDFNHRVHKDKASQKCSDCHAFASDGNFAGTPTLAGCSGCHAEPMGTTANEKVLVVSYVKPGREIPWRSYACQPMNVRFSACGNHVNLAKARLREMSRCSR